MLSIIERKNYLDKIDSLEEKIYDLEAHNKKIIKKNEKLLSALIEINEKRNNEFMVEMLFDDVLDELKKIDAGE